MRTIYFDYNATTPLDPKVREAMLPFLGEVFGNPSSVHQVGRRARALLDDARERAARVLGCKASEVVFTSGGTEANNLALFGVARLFRDRGRHIIASAVEHHAVLNCCEYLANKEGFAVTFLPVNTDGIIECDTLARALRPDTILVSVMAANNETGTKQPLSELTTLCRQRGIPFHCDAAQWFGKEPLASVHDFGADLVSLCSHKFHGPKGAGALFIRSPLLPDPILFGGSHENQRRAGTENLAAIMGFATALESFVPEPVFPATRLRVLTAHLIAALDTLPGVRFRGSRTSRLSNTVSFTVKGCDSLSLLAGLDLEGICASSGAACSAGSLLPSHVLIAMGVPPDEANSFIRLSLGRDSTLAEVEAVCEILPHIIKRIRAR